MSRDLKSKNQMPGWLASALKWISICYMLNLLFVLFQLGAFTFWKSLPDLPSSATQIIIADPDNLWVKTNDGRIFTFSLHCTYNIPCHEWVLVKDISEIEPLYPEEPSKGTCRHDDSIWPFPRNPLGKVVECVNTSFIEDIYHISFFALMSDGTVKYWSHGGNTSTPLFGILITNFFCTPVLIIITVLYSKYYKKREERAKQNM